MKKLTKKEIIIIAIAGAMLLAVGLFLFFWFNREKDYRLLKVCEVDGQGRILLPQNLREYAGLEKSVTVVGCNNHAELWDSAKWNEQHVIEMTPENIAAVMEELEF